MVNNMINFCLFGFDENSFNKFYVVYEVSKKFWIVEYLEEDQDGGELSFDGWVMEMLSEYILEGWLEVYFLIGCYGFFVIYEFFVYVIIFMVN